MPAYASPTSPAPCPNPSLGPPSAVCCSSPAASPSGPGRSEQGVDPAYGQEPVALRGQTAVVVGLGSVGSEIARLAQAVHLHVIGVCRSRRRVDDPVDELVAPDALD